MAGTDNVQLVVLAAGLGSRFGGIKQMTGIGPNGETLLDYAVFDAIRAGFSDIVLVIRPQIEAEFRDRIGRKFEAVASVSYAMQATTERSKPWGTGHAVLSARALIDAPFVVVNADDYYGPAAFAMAREHFEENNEDALLVGYRLEQTLSPHGSVSRGVCSLDDAGLLAGVTEHTNIREQDGSILAGHHNGDLRLSPDTLVSLNFWAFQVPFLSMLDEKFEEFIATNANHETAEFFLPAAVDDCIRTGRLRVATRQSPDRWFGMTYADDRASSEQAIRDLIRDEVYPPELLFR